MSGIPAGRDDHGYLLLRRSGILWGIDNSAVTGLTRRGASFRIDLGSIRTPADTGDAGDAGDTGDAGDPGAATMLAADEILCVVNSLQVQRPSGALRRFWSICPGVAGLAVYGEQPLVVVDPRRPPALLWLEQGEGNDGE